MACAPTHTCLLCQFFKVLQSYLVVFSHSCLLKRISYYMNHCLPSDFLFLYIFSFHMCVPIMLIFFFGTYAWLFTLREKKRPTLDELSLFVYTFSCKILAFMYWYMKYSSYALHQLIIWFYCKVCPAVAVLPPEKKFPLRTINYILFLLTKNNKTMTTTTNQQISHYNESGGNNEHFYCILFNNSWKKNNHIHNKG